MTSQENKHSSTKTVLIILGIIAAGIVLVIMVHEVIISAIDADKSAKQLVADLPCNWLKVNVDAHEGHWILSGSEQYANQIYWEKCKK